MPARLRGLFTYRRALVATISTALTVTALAPAAAVEETVRLGNGLLGCVDEALGLEAPTQVTAAQIATITSLECKGLTIESLDGLEHATALTYLRLNPVSISPNLREHDLNAAAAWVFLEPLRDLPHLATIEINANIPYDISWAPIGSLPEIESFGVSWEPGDGFGDLEPAADTLRSVTVDDVRNLNGLSSLTGLTALRLEGRYDFDDDFSEFAALTGLTSLETNFMSPSDGDVSALGELTNLTSLDFNYAEVDSLEGLDGAAALEKISLYSFSGLDDADLELLAGMPAVTTLKIFGAGDISTLAPLAGNTRLTKLAVTGGDLTDVSELATMPNITGLFLGGNHILDFSPLGELALTDYDAQGQRIDLGSVDACVPVELPVFTTRNGTVYPFTLTPGQGASAGTSALFTGSGQRTLEFSGTDYDPALGTYYSQITGKVTVTVNAADSLCAWRDALTVSPSGRFVTGKPLVATLDWTTPLHPPVKVEWVGADQTLWATGNPYPYTSGFELLDLHARVSGYAGWEAGTVESASTPIKKAMPEDLRVVIAGTPTVDATIDAASLSRPADVQMTFTWLRDGEPIPGATSHYYTVTPADEGHALTAVGHASDSWGRYWPTDVASAPMTVEQRGSFETPGAPRVSGSTTVGGTLKAERGTWTPEPESATYQWYRDGKPVSGATKSSLTTKASDAGHKFSVKVTGAKPGYLTTTLWSPSVTILRALTTTSTPTITGTAKVKHTLVASVGTWGPGTVAKTFQWYRNGVAISGATKSSYTVSVRDAYASITVKVTGKKAGYASVTRVSKPRVASGIAYSSCTALRADYPGGVATSSSTPGILPTTYVSASLYKLNSARDTDKDGWSCER